MLIDTVDQAARASQAGSMKSSCAGPVGDCPVSQGHWRRGPFACVVQTLIERAEGGPEECTPLKSIGNHVRTRGGIFASALRRNPSCRLRP